MSTTTFERYQRFAPFYDVLYGAALQPGRRRALALLAPRPGESILEIGVGTGFALGAYPTGCRVVGIDLSSRMIERAWRRRQRQALRHVTCCRMDAGRLAFADGAFDAVYAPYIVNVVPDPVAVAREMRRVCRRGGRLILLNHFEGVPGAGSLVSRAIGKMATALTAVDWRLDLGAFLRESGLTVQSIEPVNLAGVSSVLVCRND